MLRSLRGRQMETQTDSESDTGTCSKEQVREIVEASMEGWTVFIETGLDSRFYREASARVGEGRAARITLLYFYLNTYSLEEQERLEHDVEWFLHHAAAFLREIYPKHANPPEFHAASRRVFQRAMHGIFRRRVSDASVRPARKRELEDLHNFDQPRIDPDAHAFMRGMLTLLSSVNAIIDAYDDYREYMFRFYPQLHHEYA